MQQLGELFNSFLILQRGLTKIFKYCSESCMQKSIRDQIIKGPSDGDTIIDLLQHQNPTLKTTIAKCFEQRSHQEALL